MAKEVQTILASNTPQTMWIECLFYNKFGQQALAQVTYARSFKIVQDTIQNYADWVQLVVDVSIRQYEVLLEKAQDLKCRIRIQQRDKETDKRGLTIMQREFFVLIKERAPLTTTFTAEELRNIHSGPDQMLSLTMELVDPILYQLRKREIHFTAKGCTMHEALHYAIRQFGITKMQCVTPDNTHRYNRFVVPPSYKLATLIDFLQEAPGFGIFMRGMSCYYTNDTLYIYPTYDTEPKHGKITHLYNVGAMDLKGMENYHRVDKGGNYHIVLPGDIQHDASAQRDIENNLTGAVVARGSHIANDWLSINPAGTAVFNTNYGTLRRDVNLGIVNKETASAGRLMFSQNNPYVLGSSIARSYVNRLSCVWGHAVPLAIVPGTPCVFHYDTLSTPVPGQEDVPVCHTVPCVMEKAVYTFEITEMAGSRLFGCEANLQFAIAPTFET